jgi:glycosyltransferase involved in cell wall biosynthesis
MQPRIAICISTLGLGGAEDIVLRLANHLINHAPVGLYLLQRCDEDKPKFDRLDPRVRVHSLFSRSRPSTSRWFKIRNGVSYLLFPAIAVYLWPRLWTARVGTVHVNLTQFALYSVLWSALRRILPYRPRIIQTFHTNTHLLRSWQRAIFRLSWWVCDILVVEIDANEVTLVRRWVAKDRILYIPFAVGLPAQRTPPRRARRDVRVFGSLARLVIREKKYDVILAALERLRRRGVAFHYRIGGDGVDRREIERLIQKNQLSDCVTLEGFVRDPIRFFRQIDLLLVATVGCETGIAGLQALQSGVPIIGIDTRDNCASLSAGSRMLIANDATELAEHIERLATSLDPEEYLNQVVEEKHLLMDDTAMMQSYKRLFVVGDAAC